MSKSNLIAFRVPAELHDVFNQAVAAAVTKRRGCWMPYAAKEPAREKPTAAHA